jgi:hypothetical protein
MRTWPRRATPTIGTSTLSSAHMEAGHGARQRGGKEVATQESRASRDLAPCSPRPEDARQVPTIIHGLTGERVQLKAVILSNLVTKLRKLHFL